MEAEESILRGRAWVQNNIWEVTPWQKVKPNECLGSQVLRSQSLNLQFLDKAALPRRS